MGKLEKKLLQRHKLDDIGPVRLKENVEHYRNAVASTLSSSDGPAHWQITDDEYDKVDQYFRGKIGELDTLLSMLQEADDQYFLTAKNILDLSKRAQLLFEGSKVERKRQVIKFVLPNLELDGRIIRYDAVKPFDTILNCAESSSLARES